MQEDIERRTVAISVSASRFTGQILLKAVTSAMREIKRERSSGQSPQGKQTVKKLMNHGVSTNSIPLNGDTRIFDRIAKKYNVDYAFHKTGPKKYLLFFKAAQADAITACFSEYAKKSMKENNRPSIINQIRKFTNMILSKPKNQHERKKEATHNNR